MDEESFQCPHCPFKTSYPQSFRRHFKNFHAQDQELGDKVELSHLSISACPDAMYSQILRETTNLKSSSTLDDREKSAFLMASGWQEIVDALDQDVSSIIM